MANFDPSTIKLCECGCGQQTRPSARTTGGYRKGELQRFVVGHNRRTGRVQHHSYVSKSIGGGRHRRTHVLIAEAALGRPLPKGAEVHHVDGNKQNNTPSNLVICQDHAYHKLLHVRQRVLSAGGDPNTQRICSHCKKLTLFSDMSGGGVNNSRPCLPCNREIQRKRKAAA